MTEVASNSPVSQGSVYFTPEAMRCALKLVLSHRSCGAILLALWSNVGEGGVVRVSQAAIAHECDVTLRKLTKELAHLVDGGWIDLVNVSIEPGGPLECIISPLVLQVMKPEERV
ncbi:hypothetical protein PspTeo4_22712 [Pseudomonas sp. Teo4]|nr:hypothetical protein [Pseudomonas sp. Teo4]